MRHKVIKLVRDYYDGLGFLDVETPFLTKGTPEGAREFIVPARLWPGKFYVLPQSPQQFKQLLMVGGIDKYFQIAACFRDEDARADRCPGEFYQLDLEMSFVEQKDILDLTEDMLIKVVKELLPEKKITTIPFPRLSYEEVMKKYKTDKPDLRKDKNDPNELAFCWVVDFPLFEYGKEDKRYKSMHHPFTMPADVNNIGEKSKSVAYDIVLNGVEIGGGSIRIHKPEIQQKVFDILKINKTEAQEKFGFLLEALKFGAPPHGGLAFGFDRLVQLMLNQESIREIIAYPKNNDARDVMLNAPSDIDEKQLKEVNVEVIKKKDKKK